MAKGSGTRSGLLWEVERILEKCEELPQILLMENVPDVIRRKNIKDFQQWQNKLEQLGYSNFVKIMNAKDFGVPQNRSRCFMVSILGNYYYEFPESIPLTTQIRDVLEKEVEKKYYLSDEQMKTFKRNQYAFAACDPATITANMIEVGQLQFKTYESANRVYATRGISPTLNTMQGGGRQPKICLPKPIICACRGRKIKHCNNKATGFKRKQRIEINESGCSNTLTTVQKNNMVLEDIFNVPKTAEKGDALSANDIDIHRPCRTRRRVENERFQMQETIYADEGDIKRYSIRRLTPLECWRLMGFQDEDFFKAKRVVSNSQLYKQAGNSIVRNVVVAIFKKLLQ